MRRPDPPRVAILGAGAAGLCAAIELAEQGIDDVVIYERGDGVGGTWRANTYPGAACDVPSHLYSFSFFSKRDWSRKFAPQPEILQYFEDVADHFGLRPKLRLRCEVTDATFDDATGRWRLRVVDRSGPDEETRTEVVDVLVCALGQLNRPFVPDIDGLDRFGGPVVHSAEWDHDVVLEGRRVGVVGNGASALQFIPPVARIAAHTTVFQRSANWIIPKPDRPFRRWERAALSVPAIQRLYRWRIYWRLEINFLLMRRSSRAGALLGRMLAKRLRTLATDDLPEAALVPDYPMGCKRILISNDYYSTLRRPDVSVELDPIARVESGAVVTASGHRHELDVLLLGTGFRTTEFLAPMRVTGRHGRDLNDEWAKGAHAHLGVAVSGFPNLFVLYGPNTNLGHNSIIFMIEAQSRYVARAVRHLRDADLRWIDVRGDVMDRYNTTIQRQADRTVWVADCHSWYKNEHGLVTNNWPDFTFNYWRRMRHFRPHEWVRRRRDPPTADPLAPDPPGLAA